MKEILFSFLFLISQESLAQNLGVIDIPLNDEAKEALEVQYIQNRLRLFNGEVMLTPKYFLGNTHLRQLGDTNNFYINTAYMKNYVNISAESRRVGDQVDPNSEKFTGIMKLTSMKVSIDSRGDDQFISGYYAPFGIDIRRDQANMGDIACLKNLNLALGVGLGGVLGVTNNFDDLVLGLNGVIVGRVAGEVTLDLNKISTKNELVQKIKNISTQVVNRVSLGVDRSIASSPIKLGGRHLNGTGEIFFRATRELGNNKVLLSYEYIKKDLPGLILSNQQVQAHGLNLSNLQRGDLSFNISMFYDVNHQAPGIGIRVER